MPQQRPAYLVASSFMRDGHGSLEPYGRAVHPLLEEAGGELLVAGSSDQFMDFYEGAWNEGARFTLFRFPSMEALRKFWCSPEYQKIKHLRTDVIPPNFTFAVEGFDPAEWEASDESGRTFGLCRSRCMIRNTPVGRWI